jgi:desulfoferrodoxin-like iron-binding protein
MHCHICGRKAHCLNNGKGPLVCCGKPMVKSLVTEAGFSTKPKGWTNQSVKQYSKTFTSKMKGDVKSKGFFDKCVEKMKDKMENPEGFCASLKDEQHGSTYWRGKGKSTQQARKDVKANPNV